MFSPQITKEEINQLPLQRYEGKIVVVTDPEKQANALAEVSQHSVVGFDTETKPAFKKGVRHEVALLQLAVPDKVFLIRLNRTGLSSEVARFFADENITKVGISIRDDIKHLARLASKQRITFDPKNILELNDVAKSLKIEHAGVKKLTAIFLKFRVSKAQQTSNWENEKLTEAQLRYAATDAWVCLEIYQKLVEVLGSISS